MSTNKPSSKVISSRWLVDVLYWEKKGVKMFKEIEDKVKDKVRLLFKLIRHY